MTRKKPSFRPGLEILEDRCVPATLTVTTLRDDVGVPGLTLREAILKSNSTPAIDTIVFKAGLKGTITLGNNIDITNAVKINGPGAKLLKISGGDTTQIFNINDGNPAAPMQVSLANLTMTRGKATFGGAINNHRENVALRQCRLIQNASTFSGGAYQGNAGSLTIVDCQFVGNRAGSDGGAVAMFLGAFTARNSRFIGNQCQSIGGAIFVNQGDSAFLQRCTITNNASLSSAAGGIFFAGHVAGNGVVSINQCTIAGNSAVAGGGLVLSRAAAAIVSQCTIFGNSSVEDGGGLLLDTGPKYVLGCTIAGNVAGARGGGIASGVGVTLTVRQSTISGNTAGSLGGGIHLANGGVGEQTIQLSTIVSNTALGSGGGIGASIDVNLLGTIIARNLAHVDGQDLRGNPFVDLNAAFCLIQNTAFAHVVETPVGSNIFGVDPRLGVLKQNGGPTRTHALLKGSPAINKGVNTSPAEKFDQRGPGFKRVKAGRIDIGASER